MNKDEINNDRFIKHLKDSMGAVWEVAQWLQGRGHAVTVNPTFIRPSHDQWADYADNGDLFISQRIEVKVRGVEFTCREDWPHGDKFIVCAKHAWDRALQKPHAFIYLNKSRTYAAILMGDTHGEWTVEKRTDRRYQDVTQEFYFCPINLVKFIKFKTAQASE